MNQEERSRKLEFAKEEIRKSLLHLQALRVEIETADHAEEISSAGFILWLQCWLDRNRAILRSLENANSQFPATRNFLRSRGLEHVSELDAKGIEDLRRHLMQTLADLTSQKADESPTS